MLASRRLVDTGYLLGNHRKCNLLLRDSSEPNYHSYLDVVLDSRSSFHFLGLQRVLELEEEARAESVDFVGLVDPKRVAELFLERPRMEQRFFGFRFENLSADGLTLDFHTLNKVFTTLATIQELPLKTR